MSYNEPEGCVEASLGGRVTQDEMAVFIDELRDMIEGLDRPYLLLLDYSKSKPFDNKAYDTLMTAHELALRHGAEKIVSIVRSEDEVLAETSQAFQKVMEGKLQFVTEPEAVQWPGQAIYLDFASTDIRRAA